MSTVLPYGKYSVACLLARGKEFYIYSGVGCCTWTVSSQQQTHYKLPHSNFLTDDVWQNQNSIIFYCFFFLIIWYWIPADHKIVAFSFRINVCISSLPLPAPSSPFGLAFLFVFLEKRFPTVCECRGKCILTKATGTLPVPLIWVLPFFSMAQYVSLKISLL